MDRPSNTPHEVSPTRRSVIRAGFAVPALTTVASGSALAATSSTCFAKQLTSPIFPPPTTSANPDTYLRVQLGKFVKTVNMTTTTTYYVDGETLAATLGTRFQRSGSYPLSSDKSQRFDVSNNQEVANSILVRDWAGGTYTKNGGTFAVLRFDSTGKVVGVGRGPANTTAVGASCWSSLAP